MNVLVAWLGYFKWHLLYKGTLTLLKKQWAKHVAIVCGMCFYSEEEQTQGWEIEQRKKSFWYQPEFENTNHWPARKNKHIGFLFFLFSCLQDPGGWCNLCHLPFLISKKGHSNASSRRLFPLCLWCVWSNWNGYRWHRCTATTSKKVSFRWYCLVSYSSLSHCSQSLYTTDRSIYSREELVSTISLTC